MSKQTSYRLSPFAVLRSTASDYLELVKFRLTIMVVFTAVAAYMISSSLQMSALSIFLLALGGFCVAGASNAINQVLEKDYDSLMTRTKNRPVASGRMSSANAVLAAGFLCLFGVTILALFNPLTAFFGMMAFVLYAFVYTPLKRYSSAAIFVGAVAGAMPMLIGAVAWSGSLTTIAIVLFAIQLAWQYPHFWAIGFMGFKDYKKAGYQFIPGHNDEMPSRTIGLSAIFFSSLLLIISIALYFMGLSGILTSLLMSALSLFFLYFSYKFYRDFDLPSAKNLMLCSLVYIPFVLIILIADKIV